MKKLSLAIVISTLLTIPYASAEIKPAVVFDFGGKHDASFNEGTYNGTQRFSKETGIKIQDFEITNDAQFAQTHRKFAQAGKNPILAVGFTQAQALDATAKQFPNTQFGIIDAVVNQPNVESIVFKEQEGSFLVGMLAAMKSKTGTVGFIGGMDIPLIRAFDCGYEQGIKFVNPNIKFLQNMTGNTGEAWNNPVRGAELAQAQMDQGADVVFSAAGQTGRGVLRKMAEAKKFAIGVDSNQNYMQPGYVLTSMVKRVDVASYQFLKDAQEGKLKGGIKNLGLAEGGVDWAYDKYNKDLITPEMKAAVELAKKLIIEGTIKVHDYRDNSKCDISTATLSQYQK